MNDLTEDFIADVRAGHGRVAPDLAAWVRDPGDRASRDALFQFVHTVHGNAGFLNFERFGRLAGAAEAALAHLRDGTAPADGALMTAVARLVERIGVLAEAVEQGIGLPADDEAGLIAALGVPVPPLRMLGASLDQPRPEGGGSIRLSRDQFAALTEGFEGVAAAHRNLLSVANDGQRGPVRDAIRQLSARMARMEQALTLTRLLGVDRLFAGLDRIVSQTAATLGKEIRLETQGGALMIDRDVVEGLRDPLLHLIRNALDHGIEAPHIRGAAGKARGGTLTLVGVIDHQTFILTVADDGAGIDRAAVIAAAAARNIHVACSAEALSNAQIAALACAPGVTTATQSNALSGRGVGLDAVHASVIRLGGSFAIADRPGKGVTFTLSVPIRHAA